MNRTILGLTGLRHRSAASLLQKNCAPLQTAFLLRARTQIQARTAANSTSGRPASDNLDHARTNAKEEARAVAGAIAKGISGSSPEDISEITRVKSHGEYSERPLHDDFIKITSTIAARVPKHIFAVGLVGAVPYVATTASTLYFAREAGLATNGLLSTLDPVRAIELLDHASHIQVTYGAVLLSFIGALHWGLEFAGYNGYKGYSRLGLGVAPLLAAWPTLYLEPQLGLVAQWFIFTGAWYADMRVTSLGWTPGWYSQYRFYLSILVGSCILTTLFGLNWLGPTTDATLAKELKATGVLGSGMGYMDFAVRDDTEARKGLKTVIPAGADFNVENDNDYYMKLVEAKKEEKEEDGEEKEEGGDEKEGGEDKEGEEEGSDKDEKSSGDEKKKKEETTDVGSGDKDTEPGENSSNAKEQKDKDQRTKNTEEKKAKK